MDCGLVYFLYHGNIKLMTLLGSVETLELVSLVMSTGLMTQGVLYGSAHPLQCLYSPPLIFPPLSTVPHVNMNVRNSARGRRIDPSKAPIFCIFFSLPARSDPTSCPGAVGGVSSVFVSSPSFLLLLLLLLISPSHSLLHILPFRILSSRKRSRSLSMIPMQQRACMQAAGLFFLWFLWHYWDC